MSTQAPLEAAPARDSEVELFSVAGVDGYLREVNAAFANLLGVDPSSLDGRSLLELAHPDDVPAIVAGLAKLEAGAPEVMLENRFKRYDGGWTHLQWVARPLPGTDLWWAAGRDTTPFHELLAEGIDLRARLDLAVGPATAAMWELDVKQEKLTWENHAAPLLGVEVGDLPPTMLALSALVHPEHEHALASAVADVVRLGRTDIELSVGEGTKLRHLSMRGKVLDRDRRGRAQRAVGLLVDMTNEKAMEEQMLRMVMSDALTGAPNRRAFDQVLRTAWRRCARSGEPLSIVMIDIDNFKKFNDTFGHLVGDEVLTAVSRALSANVNRVGDSVARFGGEEFALALPGADSPGAVVVAERLCAAVRGVTIRQAQGWGLSVSVGVATWQPEDGALKSPQLLSRADQALYVAKSAGKDRVVSYELALSDRAKLEDAIRAGMAAEQFEMQYQPVIVLATGEVHGFDAALRWNRPGHGVVEPDEFLAVAEKSDLICDLGRLALRLACTQFASWVGAGGAGEASMTVAVRLSGRQVGDPKVVADVASALEASGLPPRCLEVQLSETALDAGVLVQAHLTQIRRLGVAASIADFGTGHTSVAQLPRLPVDSLKVDRSLVASPEPQQRALVALLVSAAHSFGLRAIAEGVESEETAAILRGLGCELVQGDAIAPLMAADAVPTWLARRSSQTSLLS